MKQSDKPTKEKKATKPGSMDFGGKTVIYKTDQAVFHFVMQDVIDYIQEHFEKYKSTQVPDIQMEMLLEKGSTNVVEDKPIFSFVACALLLDGKGTAWCVECGKIYHQRQLRRFRSRGDGSGNGRISFDCPVGHTLVVADPEDRKDKRKGRAGYVPL